MFDFSNAQLPRLFPLEASYTENEVESDLKNLFIDLFNQMLASDVFDVNVSGAAHLGSFDLVRKAVNTDGLVLLQGDDEEAATRYLYRAWRSCNVQGRGLHFLKTYLQLLFPNLGEVIQLWHGKNKPYPTDLRTEESEDTFLTSRIRVSVIGFPNADNDNRILKCINQIISARFVIKLRYIATSSIGKIRPVSCANLSQSFNTSGELIMTLDINGKTKMLVSSAGVGTNYLRTYGGVD